MQLRRGPRVLCIYVELSSMDELRANCITMKQAKIQNVFNPGTLRDTGNTVNLKTVEPGNPGTSLPNSLSGAPA